MEEEGARRTKAHRGRGEGPRALGGNSEPWNWGWRGEDPGSLSRELDSRREGNKQVKVQRSRLPGALGVPMSGSGAALVSRPYGAAGKALPYMQQTQARVSASQKVP